MVIHVLNAEAKGEPEALFYGINKVRAPPGGRHNPKHLTKRSRERLEDLGREG